MYAGRALSSLGGLPTELKNQIYRKLAPANQRSWKVANRNMQGRAMLHLRLQTQLLSALALGSIADMRTSIYFMRPRTATVTLQQHLGEFAIYEWPGEHEVPRFSAQQRSEALAEAVQRAKAIGALFVEVKLEHDATAQRRQPETEMRGYDAAWKIFPQGELVLSVPVHGGLLDDTFRRAADGTYTEQNTHTQRWLPVQRASIVEKLARCWAQQFEMVHLLVPQPWSPSLTLRTAVVGRRETAAAAPTV